MISLLLLLVLTSDPEDGVWLPDWSQQGLTARLNVRVADPIMPGLARVEMLVVVEGPSGLFIDGPRLEDARAAWRIARQTSSLAEDEWTQWECRLQLEQVKPGPIPLPGLQVRLRPSGSAEWLTVSWPEPLREPMDVLELQRLPEVPPSRWPLALAAVGGVLGVLGLLGWCWLRYRRCEQPSAHQQTIARLDRCLSGEPQEALPAGLAILFEWLAQPGGIPANRLTSRELLSALEARQVPSAIVDQLRDILQIAEQIKYAGRPLEAADWPAVRDRLRRLLEELATWPTSGSSGKLREKDATR